MSNLAKSLKQDFEAANNAELIRTQAATIAAQEAAITSLQADIDQANSIIAANLTASDEAVKRLMGDNAKLRAMLQRWHNASTWADVNGLRIMEASEWMADDMTKLEQDTTEALK